MRRLAFAAAILASLLVAGLVLANLAVWTGTRPDVPGTSFFHQDVVLHDTYYVAASAGQLAMTTQFALLHVLAGLFCAVQAQTLRGSLVAGWIFVAGAALAFIAQASTAGATWFAVRSMPERIIDYAAPDAWTTVQNVSTVLSLIGFAAMLAGWPILAIAALRRTN